MIHRWMGVIVGMGLASSLQAESVPEASANDSRIRTATFNPTEVYRLYGHVGYAIEIVFEDGESGAGQAGGDLEAITLGWHENHLILKPKAPTAGTNLIIYTNRRAYRFDYSVSARRPDPGREPVMFAVQFSYPEAFATRRPEVEKQLDKAIKALEENVPRRALNTDYSFCGSGALKPTAASDDGVHTRLTFGSRGEVPAVFVRNEDGSESLLNFSMEGADMVIHRVAPKFILRRGRLTACVVNKGYVGSGERLPSGTVATGVERERREAAE